MKPMSILLNSSWEETLTKKIKSSDYYFLVFLLPSIELNVTHEMSFEHVTIDLTELNSSYIGSLTYSTDSLTAELDGWREDYCLVGDIYSYEMTWPFVHAEVWYTLNYSKTLGLTLGLGIPLLLLWIVSVLMCIFGWRKCHGTNVVSKPHTNSNA